MILLQYLVTFYQFMDLWNADAYRFLILSPVKPAENFALRLREREGRKERYIVFNGRFFCGFSKSVKSRLEDLFQVSD